MDKLKKMINILVIIILIIIVFVLINNKNKSQEMGQQVVSETTGVSSLGECFDAYCGMEKYLEENLAWTTKETGIDFCSFNWLNEEDYQNNIPIFLNVLCQEYYIDSGGYLKEASGFSGPVEIQTDEQTFFVSSWQPLTADDNTELIQKFGSYYQKYLDNQYQDSIEFEKNNLINARQYFNADIEYEVIEALGVQCNTDFDCTLPFNYSIKSDCRYRTMCVKNECTVICQTY